jgi:hypothetical protein
VPPTSNTFGGGCSQHLRAPGTAPFFFVIRTQNIPKGVVFTVTLFDEANRPSEPTDMQPTNGERINRLVATFTPNVDLAGIELVAVVQADGRATTCNGHTCKRNELTSIEFT